ncbi:hypothetical protein HK102_007419, partial [Quaeritorhiza haematococci]
VVTTTTTTLHEFPPLRLAPPPLPKPLDPNVYPLANTPTPPALKKFCFDLDGVPTQFKELESLDEQWLRVQQSPREEEAEGDDKKKKIVKRKGKKLKKAPTTQDQLQQQQQQIHRKQHTAIVSQQHTHSGVRPVPGRVVSQTITTSSSSSSSAAAASRMLQQQGVSLPPPAVPGLPSLSTMAGATTTTSSSSSSATPLPRRPHGRKRPAPIEDSDDPIELHPIPQKLENTQCLQLQLQQLQQQSLDDSAAAAALGLGARGGASARGHKRRVSAGAPGAPMAISIGTRPSTTATAMSATNMVVESSSSSSSSATAPPSIVPTGASTSAASLDTPLTPFPDGTVENGATANASMMTQLTDGGHGHGNASHDLAAASTPPDNGLSPVETSPPLHSTHNTHAAHTGIGSGVAGTPGVAGVGIGVGGGVPEALNTHSPKLPSPTLSPTITPQIPDFLPNSAVGQSQDPDFSSEDLEEYNRVYGAMGIPGVTGMMTPTDGAGSPTKRITTSSLIPPSEAAALQQQLIRQGPAGAYFNNNMNMTRTPTLADIPFVLSTFDSLAPPLKSYLLLHLLHPLHLLHLLQHHLHHHKLSSPSHLSPPPPSILFEFFFAETRIL